MKKLSFSQFIEHIQYHLSNLFGSMQSADRYFREHPDQYRQLLTLSDSDCSLGVDPYETACAWWTMKIAEEDRAESQWTEYFDLVGHELLVLFNGITPMTDFFKQNPKSAQSLRTYAVQEMRRGVAPAKCAEQFFRWRDVIADFEHNRTREMGTYSTSPGTAIASVSFTTNSTTMSTGYTYPRHRAKSRRTRSGVVPEVVTKRQARQQLWKEAKCSAAARRLEAKRLTAEIPF